MSTGAKVAIGAVIAIVVLIPLVTVGLLALAVSSSGDDTPEPDSSCEAFSYVGNERLDRCARPGEAIEIGGLSFTAEALEPGIDRFDQEGLCTEVTVTNTTDESQSLFDLAWGLQRPGGQIEDSLLGVDFAASGVAAGASTSGRVCFDGVEEEDGDFDILWDSPIEEDRAAWVGPVEG